MAVTEEQIAVVKATVPILREHGKTITSVFYDNLLAAHPQLANIFSLRNQQTGLQQAALADAVFAYANYIDDLPKLSGAVERIAQKHASLFIKPEQYPIVGEHLLGAMAEVLGDALTDEVKEAWGAAYGQLADVFIGREKQLYAEFGNEWQSWRKFTIAEKTVEAEGIANFYLEPTDKLPIPKYLPGQYVSLQIPIPQLGGVLQSRQFSLSLAPVEQLTSLRITVKREDADDSGVAGLVSTQLHDQYAIEDEVELSAPRGDFGPSNNVLRSDAPIVLLSAGVGATAVLPILDSLSSSRVTSYIHTARSLNKLSFYDQVKNCKKTRPNLDLKLFVKTGIDRRQFLHEGKLDLSNAEVSSSLHLTNPATEYFVCGPEEWMIAVRSWLKSKNVETERVHLELFRTGTI